MSWPAMVLRAQPWLAVVAGTANGGVSGPEELSCMTK